MVRTCPFRSNERDGHIYVQKSIFITGIIGFCCEAPSSVLTSTAHRCEEWRFTFVYESFHLYLTHLALIPSEILHDYYLHC